MGGFPVIPDLDDDQQKLGRRGQQGVIAAPTDGPQPASGPAPVVPKITPQLGQRRTSDEAALQSATQRGSGISQLPTAARIPLRVLEGIGGAILPKVTARIPGTEMHHEAELGQMRANLGQDVAQLGVESRAGAEQTGAAKNAEEIPTIRPKAEADIEHVKQETENLKNPPPKEEAEGRTITTDQGVMQWDPKTHAYDIRAGGAPAKPEATEVIQREVGGQQHNFLIDKATGKDIKDLGPKKMEAEPGSWSLQEISGKPVFYNSKTREIKEAPEGFAKAGTAAKAQQLTPATQGILQTTAPVKDQVEQLQKSLDDYIKENPQNGGHRMTVDRLKYAVGMASPEGELAEQISKLELDRVMAGARVLKGSSRAYQALELAMKHAPNPWVDSVELMRQKLANIHQNLADVERDAVQYGTKTQTVGDAEHKMGAAQPNQSGELTPPSEAAPGMKWQHRTMNGKTEWRQVPQ